MKQVDPDFITILDVLSRHGVEFIVVGGVCGALHGAPIATFDLDVVHSRRPENIDRLTEALDEMSARSRVHLEQNLKPGRTHLESPGHQLLMTRFGPLDLLGTVGKERGYEDLVKRCVEMQVGSRRVKVLDLDTLIELKEETGAEKDRAVLPILRRTRDEKRKQ